MASDKIVGEILGKVSVVAAAPDTARAILTTPDAFVGNQSVFDRQARLNLPERARAVSEADYLGFLETQVRAWSDGELAMLETILVSVSGKFARLRFDLPETVYLVKTSGAEEGFAAYTRRMDTIVLPETKVSGGPGAGADALHPPDATEVEDTIMHEFFHLFSKNNPKTRRVLYGLVNYHQFDRPVPLPDVDWRYGAAMPALKITNPDTPVLDVAIRMPLPGSPDVETPLMPVLLAGRPYETGLFFDYLEWWFLEVHEAAPGDWQVVLDERGRPVAASRDAMMGAYLARVGRNIPHEIFHPDEILAQSFVLAMNEPNLDLLQRIAGEVSVAG